MSLALCPHCQKKVQIPSGLAAGTVIQCASCNAQFLPPASTASTSTGEFELTVKKKRKKRSVEREGMSSTAKALIGIAIALVVLGAGVGAYWIFKPSHAKFNEVIVMQYQRYQAILKQSINEKQINNLQSFLKQIQNLGNQLAPVRQELENVRVPEDAQYIVNAFTSMVKSTEILSQKLAPQLLEKLKSKPRDEEAMTELYQSLSSISSQHESLVSLQNKMAKKYGLLQIQPPSEDASIFPRVRQ